MSSRWLWMAVVLGLPALGYLYQRFAEAREARSSVPPGELIDIGGRRLHVIRQGTGGPTVVMEAGGAGSSTIWWPLQERLGRETTVVTYDRAGLGWSDAAPLPRTLEQRGDDLEAMLRHAGVSPPYVLVGLSYGGPLIRLFAERHPDQVAGMVFVDIAHEVVFSTPGAQKYLKRTSALLRGFGRLAQLGIARLLRLRAMPQPPTALPYSDEQRRALASRFPTVHSFFAGADEFYSMGRIGEAMAALGAPGLLRDKPIVVLSHGKPFPGMFAVLENNHMVGQQALAALSSNSALIVAQESSHGIPVEEPEVVLDAVRTVIQAVRTGLPLGRGTATPSGI
jgi:pimeloyl-ACP methyl ester carboxylesterase